MWPLHSWFSHSSSSSSLTRGKIRSYCEDLIPGDSRLLSRLLSALHFTHQMRVNSFQTQLKSCTWIKSFYHWWILCGLYFLMCCLLKKKKKNKNSPPGIIKFSWIFYLFKLWGTLKHLFDIFLRWEMLSKQDANNFNMKASVSEVKCTKDSY